ncbi:hypothetical protein [Methylibium petroleiphilum]|uniref:Uncharacterized protein n=1 Tax=Methylibium petroleiphilum (strain ATCC BAA-1232 / LMG 22953 / PM1) TaxID=420662 RepID=A2SMQ3_METPP|nr:hypothetical protein [Methylibium petroleiphilum]ABM96842.1 hypothetical protein Mpe_B0063 [Methylibium petroleiphilum PM1]
MSSENMLDVGPALGGRFNIGMHDMRYFIAIPQDVKEWFSAMPWLHVALTRGGTALSLVCERLRHAGAFTPEFALNFEVISPKLIKALANYHFLDVREIVPSSREDQDAGVVHIGRDVLMTLDIRVVDGGQTFLALLDGRSAEPSRHRPLHGGLERGPLDGGDRSMKPRSRGIPGTFRGGLQQRAKHEAR